MHMRRGIVVAVCIGLLFVGFLTLRRQLGIEFSPESLRSAVRGVGVWGPALFVVLVAFRVPLGLPSQLMLLGGGLVFGAVAGTLYGALGLVISAVVLFLGARWTGRTVIEKKVPPRLQPLFDIAGSRAGVGFIAVGTGYPFGPITMYHLMAGVTAMSLVGFILAAAIGCLVRAATFTYFGSTLATGEFERILQGGALLSLALIVPLLFPRPRAWLLQATGRQPVAVEPAQSSESRR